MVRTRLFKKKKKQFVECLRKDDGNYLTAVFSICVLAQSGVLLLNAVLTVRASKANSHKGRGWETFTDAVVQWLSNNQEGLVFMLWGAYAQKKGAAIDGVSLQHCGFKRKRISNVHASKFMFSVSAETPPRPAGGASFPPVRS